MSVAVIRDQAGVAVLRHGSHARVDDGSYGGGPGGGGYDPPIPQSDVDGLTTALAARLSSSQVQVLIDNAISALVAGAPGALDTLNELAAALGDDANFASTVMAAINALPSASLGGPLEVPETDAETILTATDGVLDNRWILITPGTGQPPSIVLPDPRTLDPGQEVVFTASPGCNGAAYAYWYSEITAVMPMPQPATYDFTGANETTVTFEVEGQAPIVVTLDQDYVDISGYATALLVPLLALQGVAIDINLMTGEVSALNTGIDIVRTVTVPSGELVTQTFFGGPEMIKIARGLEYEDDTKVHLWEPAEPFMQELHHARIVCGPGGWYPLDIKPNTADRVVWHHLVDPSETDPLDGDGFRTFARESVEEGLIAHERASRAAVGVVVTVTDANHSVTVLRAATRNEPEVDQVAFVGHRTVNMVSMTAPRTVTLPDLDPRMGGVVVVKSDGSQTVTVVDHTAATIETITVAGSKTFRHGPTWSADSFPAHDHDGTYIGSGSNRLLPDPSTLADGKIVKVVSNAWVAVDHDDLWFQAMVDAAVGEYLVGIPGVHSTISISTNTANSCSSGIFIPFLLRRATTFDRMGIVPVTAGTDAGVRLEVAVMQKDAATNMPLLTGQTDLGSIAVGGTNGVLKETTLASPLTMPAGLNWIHAGLRTDGTTAGTNPVFYGISVSGALFHGRMALDSNNANPRLGSSRVVNTPITGSGGPFLSWLTTTVVPRLAFRVSAYP